MKVRTNLTAAFLMAILFAPPIFAQNALSLTATSTGEATIVTTIAASEVRVRQASGPFVAYYVTDSAATPGRVRIEPGASYSFFGISGGGYSATATVGSIRLVAGGPVAFEVIQLPKSTSGVTSFNTRTGPVTTQSSDIPDNAANTSGTASNLSGTPALPNGTTATTQSQADGSTKLSTTAYVDTALGGKATKICSQVAIAMPTAQILTAAESTTATGTCTGLTTSDSIICTSSVHITGVTGFVPSASGVLTITTWPTSNTINASYINNTSGSITPGALTINCGAVK